MKSEFLNRNLLITGFNDDIRIKVGDFGLAQHLSSNFQDYSKLDSDVVLPIRWTAVEVLRTHKVTQKSDVWSFGMLYLFVLNDTTFRCNNVRNP